MFYKWKYYLINEWKYYEFFLLLATSVKGPFICITNRCKYMMKWAVREVKSLLIHWNAFNFSGDWKQLYLPIHIPSSLRSKLILRRDIIYYPPYTFSLCLIIFLPVLLIITFYIIRAIKMIIIHQVAQVELINDNR